MVDAILKAKCYAYDSSLFGHRIFTAWDLTDLFFNDLLDDSLQKLKNNFSGLDIDKERIAILGGEEPTITYDYLKNEFLTENGGTI